MQIIMDADACPKAIRQIVYRAAEKARIPLTLVANTHIRTPPSPLFRSVTVTNDIDEADDRIVDMVCPGDLVITADIPLADRVIKKGARALDPRGELYTEDTIGSRLAIRDLLDELRSMGEQAGGPAPLSTRDRESFANALQMVIAEGKGR